MFWNKTATNDPRDTNSEEISRLKSRINRLEAEVLDIMTAQEVIRDKVLRKIRLKDRNTEDESDSDTVFGIPKTKEINKSALS